MPFFIGAEDNPGSPGFAQGYARQAGVRSQVSDDYLDPGLQKPDPRPQTPDSRRQTPDSGPQGCIVLETHYV